MGLSHGQIALKLGISQPAVSKLVKQGMPVGSMKAAIEWRMKNCRRYKPKPPEEKLAKRYGLITSEPEPEPTKAPELNIEMPAMDILDDMESIESDFDGVMVEQSKAVILLAFNAFKAAAHSGHATNIANALKNWSEAGKTAAGIRERFLEIQKQERTLVDVDEVLSVVGEEVVEWKRLFTTLGDRLSGRVSPEVAELINEEIDTVFKNMGRAENRAKSCYEKPI